MKLIDVLRIIPESTEFYVEEYDERNVMTYAYMIEPYIMQDRDNLKGVLNNEIVRLYPSTNSKGSSTLTIEIRSTLKD